MRRSPVIGARAAGSGGGTGKRQALDLPRGACDCHVHLFGRRERYPLSRDRAYTPGLAEVADAKALLRALNMERLVLVQPSAYGVDNSCLLDGLAELGEQARGVAVLPLDVSDEQLTDLHAAGVRGLRINIGGPEEDTSGKGLAEAVIEYGARLAGSRWFIQLHAPAAAIVEARSALLRFQGALVIDHFANVPAAALPDGGLCCAVEAMLEDTEAYLKLSAHYRVARTSEDLYRLRDWVLRLVEHSPHRLLWGSDWPHTPPHGQDIDPHYSVGFRNVDAAAELSALLSWIGDTNHREMLLVGNPERLFGFSGQP